MLTEYIPPGLIQTAQNISPLLTASALVYIGYAVEKNYTSRPALFANGFAILVFFLSHLLPQRRMFEALTDPIQLSGQVVYPGWAVLELYVFFSLLAGVWGMTSYSAKRSNNSIFYTLTRGFYNSGTVGMVIFATFLLSYPS